MPNRRNKVHQHRLIRAVYDDETITVYQAYRSEIAVPAAETNQSPPAFKVERMTWIKPSFLWMMYRSGWATKPGQEYVLAIQISRSGFEWALENSTISHFVASNGQSHEQWRASLSAPVRIQWDPERDLELNKLNYRSVQVGLSGEAVSRYCNEWNVSIDDITERAHEIHSLVRAGEVDRAEELLPRERGVSALRRPRRKIHATSEERI